MIYRTIIVSGPEATGKTFFVDKLIPSFSHDLTKYSIRKAYEIARQEGFTTAADKFHSTRGLSLIPRGIVYLADVGIKFFFVESNFSFNKEDLRHFEGYCLPEDRDDLENLINEIISVKALEGYEKEKITHEMDIEVINGEAIYEIREVATLPVDLETAPPEEMEEVFAPGYPISEMISKYLSDIYEPTDAPDRYTYKPGSAEMGVIVYNDRHIFSHHSEDPAGGKLLNALQLLEAHGRKTETQKEYDAQVAQSIKEANGDITPEIEASAKAANDLAAESDPTLRGLDNVQNALDRAKEYGLEAEVILWAVLHALANPEAAVAECMAAGLSEWDV